VQEKAKLYIFNKTTTAICSNPLENLNKGAGYAMAM
jgi:hypothetical protein